MAWTRHVPVLVIALLLLVVARQIWPYADVHDPVVEEGMQVDLLIGNLGGPTCMEWLDNETMLVCYAKFCYSSKRTCYTWLSYAVFSQRAQHRTHVWRDCKRSCLQK